MWLFIYTFLWGKFYSNLRECTGGAGETGGTVFLGPEEIIYMIDIITSFAVIAGTYLGSACFTILLFRIFFPLKIKPVSDKISVAYLRNSASPAAPSKSKMYLLSVDGRRRAWVKVSS